MKLKTEFTFDAAHRLVGYKGLCHQLHGHIWRVVIEIEGSEINDTGILWDFTNVKSLKSIFDHKTILKKCDENTILIDTLQHVCGMDSVVVMRDNPTAEHLAILILRMISKSNPKFNIKVKVYESPKSYAETGN